MTKEKMKIYRRRQTVLLICIAVVIIAVITAIVLIFVSKDTDKKQRKADGLAD